MKNTIPIKIPLLFSRPKKIRASFIDPQKSLLAKMSETNSEVGIFLGIKYEPLSDPPPVIKICEWGPWVYSAASFVRTRTERTSERTSAWEARVWGAYIWRGLFLEFYGMSLFNKAMLSKYDLSDRRRLFQQ